MLPDALPPPRPCLDPGRLPQGGPSRGLDPAGGEGPRPPLRDRRDRALREPRPVGRHGAGARPERLGAREAAGDRRLAARPATHARPDRRGPQAGPTGHVGRRPPRGRGVVRYLIVNGDDLGASDGVNQGIVEAHRRGILTSASLMVNAPASRAAALLCRSVPDLSVGLHVDAAHALGRRTATATAWLRDLIESQVDRFHRLMSRLPTHIDSHHDVHRDPRITVSFLQVARRLDLPLRFCSPVSSYTRFYGQWAGVSHFEQIGHESLARILETEIADGVNELVCHPGYAGPDLASSYKAEREVELKTLCDPVIRGVLDAQAITLISYHDLAGPLRAAHA